MDIVSKSTHTGGNGYCIIDWQNSNSKPFEGDKYEQTLQKLNEEIKNQNLIRVDW